MGKKDWKDMSEKAEEMSLEEAKAFRASLYKGDAEPELSAASKREQFRLFWAREKAKYGKTKILEEILWVHLKSAKLDDPSKFEEGLKHFGLKKV